MSPILTCVLLLDSFALLGSVRHRGTPRSVAAVGAGLLAPVDRVYLGSRVIVCYTKSNIEGEMRLQPDVTVRRKV